ncbi:hypothetical protein [Tolypothrix sp. PCC 7601]|uniref:hypothetical protein n=1 Tax=Tolypothrix sp. PCC 7601 TaxID=1188 RepID=UPI0021E093DF|nr:hypothetical protein [Tolypothrix sp. PCC 7601]UYD38966.1 hypothetical protein HG267_41500 [Tolypothrix sp. PCC 7601]
MNQDTADRLGELTPNLLKFLELHPDEQKWLYPLLGKAERRAIDILQTLQNRFLTYGEIASEVGIHANTVQSILYALTANGLTTYNSKTRRYSTPNGGRNRLLKKIGDSDK